MARQNPDEEVRSLTNALEATLPRSQQALTWILLEGNSLAVAAARLGIPPSKFEIHLLRAVVELGGLPEPVADPLSEQRLASELVAALASRREPTDPSWPLHRVWRTLVRFRELGPEVLREREERIRREEASPAAARREWLRKIAIVVVILVSLFFYWKQRPV